MKNYLSCISNKQYALISASLGIMLFSMVAYRAVYLSMTYDEVWTFDLASQSVRDIMTADHNFNSANNHPLNSILIKPFLWLFGHHIWVLRLPNVLSFLLYFTACVLMMHHLSRHNVIRLCGLLILCLNIYILDFFSLSRGYGLANAFEMMSLAMMLLFLKREKIYPLVCCFFFATIAIIANFTWLNFYVPLWLFSNGFLVYRNRINNQPPLKNILKVNIAPLAFAAIVAAVCYGPMVQLSKQNEFQWGANAWFDSFHTFAKDLNYASSIVYAVVTQILLLLFFVFACRVIVRNYQRNKVPPIQLIFFVSLIALIISETIVQRFLLNVMYMDSRKATMYMALLGGMFLSLLDHFSNRYQKQVFAVAAGMGIFVCLHFCCCLRLNTVREWQFDAYTDNVAQFVDSHPIDGERSIGPHWRFGASLGYYNRFRYNGRLQIHIEKDMKRLQFYPVYYYLPENEYTNIFSEYSIVQRFDNGTILLAKNPG